MGVRASAADSAATASCELQLLTNELHSPVSVEDADATLPILLFRTARPPHTRMLQMYPEVPVMRTA